MKIHLVLTVLCYIQAPTHGTAFQSVRLAPSRRCVPLRSPSGFIHSCRRNQPVPILLSSGQQTRIHHESVAYLRLQSRLSQEADPEHGPTKNKLRPSTTPLPISRDISAFLSTALLICSTLLISPLPSHAAYGPSGAAVTSPAVVKPVTVDQFRQLSEKKQLQYQTGVKACFQETGGAQCKPTSILDSLIRDINDIILQNDKNEADEVDAAAAASSSSTSEDKKEEVFYSSDLQKEFEERQETRESDILQRDRLLVRQSVLQGLAAQPNWVSFAAAFLGSAVSTCVMHPLDTLKTRIMAKGQNKDTNGSSGDGGGDETISDVVDSWGEETSGGGVSGDGAAAVASVSSSSLGGVSVAFNIGSLYEGLAANIAKEALPSAMYLGIYEVVRTMLDNQALFQAYPIASYLVAGACGELVGSVIRAPSEAVKTKIQTSGATLPDAFGAVILSSEGWSNTFRAWSVSILRDVPAGAIQIAMFEIIKQTLVDSPLEVDVNTLLSEALIGGFGGGLGAFLTTPFDFATTAILTSSNSDSSDEHSDAKSLSAGDILSKKFAEDGLSGLFTGSVERTLYWAMAVGIFLSCYCSFRQFALQSGL